MFNFTNVPAEKKPGTQWIDGWVNLITVQTFLERGSLFVPAGIRTPDSPARSYTADAIRATQIRNDSEHGTWTISNFHLADWHHDFRTQKPLILN